MKTLAQRALSGFVKFIIAIAMLILLPAWTLRFWQAWLYVTLLGACCGAIGLYLLRHDPALMERRLTLGPQAERERSQRVVQTIASLCVCAVFIVAGLDHRWHWSPRIAPAVSLAADVVFVAGFWLIFATFRANSYASGTVQIGEGQRVISSGPYGYVRHPLYAGAIVSFLAAPFALGSWMALVPAIALTLAIGARLLDEERYLTRHLPGYLEYTRQVRFRLLPFVW